MAVTTKDLQNKQLISLADGKKIGEVRDLYLDGDMQKVAAVYLGKEGGLFSKKSHALARNFVSVMGVDAWLVDGAFQIVEPSMSREFDQFALVGDVRGREVQTEGGTKIGVVEDALVDDQGNVQAFTLGKVYVLGPLADRKVIGRAAVKQLGTKSAPMIADMAQAEELVKKEEAAAATTPAPTPTAEGSTSGS